MCQIRSTVYCISYIVVFNLFRLCPVVVVNATVALSLFPELFVSLLLSIPSVVPRREDMRLTMFLSNSAKLRPRLLTASVTKEMTPESQTRPIKIQKKTATRYMLKMASISDGHWVFTQFVQFNYMLCHYSPDCRTRAGPSPDSSHWSALDRQVH